MAIEDAKSKFHLHNFPKNLYFIGSGLSDDILKNLYINAKLVVIPIFFKSVSNRLLEALYYGRPILTNSIAKLLHNKLAHLHHVFISNNYQEYPNIIRKLLRNDTLLEKLSLGAKEAYRTYFSSRRCGLLMEKVIKSLTNNN